MISCRWAVPLEGKISEVILMQTHWSFSCPSYPVHKTLLMFWHHFFTPSGICFLLCIHLCIFCIFYGVLKFSPLWDIRLLSVKMSWVIPVWQNNKNTKAFQNTVVSKKYCFQQLMMCLEAYIVFLFYAFSFPSGDTNGLTKLAAYSEGTSARFYFLSMLCKFWQVSTFIYSLLAQARIVSVQRMSLTSIISTWSTILKKEHLITTQYFILVALIHQNWLQLGKQYTLSPVSPLNNHFISAIAVELVT